MFKCRSTRVRDGVMDVGRGKGGGWGDVMSDVVMVCVREDIERAEQLADMFDDFAFSVSDDVSDEALARCGAGVVVWTDAAAASAVLAEVTARVMASGKGVALNFSGAPAPEGAALSYDLSAWSGDPEDPELDAMFFALDRMVVAARAACPVLQQIAEKAAAKAAPRRTPVPAAVRAAPALQMRTMVASFAVLGALIIGALAIDRVPEAPAPAVVALPAVPDQAPRVGLADASARQVAYDLTAPPVEDASVGRRGFEPPSAANIRRAERTPSPVRAWERPAPHSTSHVPASFEVEAPASAPLPIASDQEAAKPRAKPDGHA